MKKYSNKILHLFPFVLLGLSFIACNNIFTDVQPNKSEHQDSQATASISSEATTALDSQTVVVTETPAAEPSPTPTQISGLVVNSLTNEPLHATIYVGTQSGAAQTASIDTDSSGVFQIDNVEFPFIMRAEVPGYELWKTQIDSHEALMQQATPNLEINLIPQITQGIIYAADTNEPLAGVVITVDFNDDSQTVTTDDSGAFKMYSLLPNARLIISAPAGYLSDEIVFSESGDLPLSVALQPRQVGVTVLDSFTGQPVVNSEVTFNDTATGLTDTQGKTILSNISESGQILASSPGYITVTVDYDASETVEITLTPSGIQGVIRAGDTGQPLPQAAIYWGDTFFRVDDTGHFVLETLPDTPTQMMIKIAGYHRTYAQLSQTGIFTGYDNPPFAGVEGRWLAPTACTQNPQPDGPPCLDISLEPFHAKAIYVPLHYLRSRERMIKYLDFIAETELNAIIVDVKGDFGFVAWDSKVKLVSEIGADEWYSDVWMPFNEFIAEARARNIYTIARFVVFKDNPLSHAKPEWAAVTEDGDVWIDREELGWVNPFREEVWDYNIELAKEVAAAGFDELNFDYIRFPSDGNVKAIVYEEEFTLETRTDAIRAFMTRLSEGLQPYGVFISADVFGLTLWVVPTSDMHIGQRVIDVAPHIDYLAPMVYPSTFGPGNLGYDNPSAEPYGIVYRSQKEAETLVPPYVKVRPWLQGYWYSLEEMQLLKQAAIDAESPGWTWWNAGGKYDIDLFEPAEEQE